MTYATFPEQLPVRSPPGRRLAAPGADRAPRSGTLSAPMDPAIAVLLLSSLAAASSTAGILPLVRRPHVPLVTIGWAHALAAGAMLGAAFVLMTATLDRTLGRAALGALLGIAFVRFTHAASGTEDLDLGRVDETGETYGYKVLLVNALHSASEGVAIGAAVMVNLPFGVFVALSMGAHNVPEATALGAVLRAGGVRLAHAAGLAVVSNVPQVLMAVVAVALIQAAPALLQWALGFAFGALVYLVLAEHLPESYRKAGHTTIALVTIVAMGIVVLIGGAGGG